LRIVNFDIGKSGVIKVSGVAEDLSIYESTTNDLQDQLVANVYEASADFEILDIPLLPHEQQTNKPRVLIACCSNNNAMWSGCTIVYSGAANGMMSVKRQAVIGRVLSALPSKSPYLFDNTSSVIVNLIGGNLLNISDQALFNGGNLAIIGNEIVQFQNAQLLQQNQYRISGFLRGQQGTEHEISSHQNGERFVLLNDQLTVIELPLSCFEQELKWHVEENRAMTADHSMVVRCQASSLTPLSPVNMQIIDDDNNLIITWDRRSLNFGVWRDFGDATLSTEAELYKVQFISEGQLLHEEIVTTNQCQVAKSNLLSLKSNHDEIHISQLSALVGSGNTYVYSFET
jgi:hypothetical protein